MFLSVQNLRKSFGREVVIHDLSVDMYAHETLSILGRSGCGKTTLLKILAGLESPDQGTITLNGNEITELPPQHRGAVYLYQEPLLFPHLSVRDNIAFGLTLRRIDDAVVHERVQDMLERIGLLAHADKMPDQLSGGQKQRVAFGRAVIINPDLLLLDEPFASLDVDTRASMQQLFRELSERYAFTSIFVTHDLKEALLMGHRIAYMERGMLTVYPTKEAFARDSSVGVIDEIAFWKELDARINQKKT